MMETILSRIVKDKRQWLLERKQRQPLSTFIERIEVSDRDFYQALSSRDNVFILECKKASPSKGLIRENFEPELIAKVYCRYASAISVLTDEKYFQGDFDYLRRVSQCVMQPVLCKDFIIDAYQVYLARYYQANAILLMLSVLDDEQYIELSQLAHRLKMGVLTEISNQQELERAIALKAKVVGINNRNLRDMSIDLNRTKQFARQLSDDVIVISESGIYHHHQIDDLSRYANGFLIGSALMARDDLEQAVQEIIFGRVKICGLTQLTDAEHAYRSGALYGGLIFAQRSPRCISPEDAQTLVERIALKWVGVFSENSVDEIVSIAKRLHFSAVQLHGNTVQHDLDDLRRKLPDNCQIWLAQPVAQSLPPMNYHHVDRYLLDNGHGGTGQTFNWQLLADIPQNEVILAGGLSCDNASQAVRLGGFALDFNSGLEHSAGIKDHHKITELFQILRINKRSKKEQ
jgi:indole-3-glycerol phosphate synthase/phosphoribosylanthranilate isomerase